MLSKILVAVYRVNPSIGIGELPEATGRVDEMPARGLACMPATLDALPGAAALAAYDSSEAGRHKVTHPH